MHTEPIFCQKFRPNFIGSLFSTHLDPVFVLIVSRSKFMELVSATHWLRFFVRHFVFINGIGRNRHGNTHHYRNTDCSALPSWLTQSCADSDQIEKQQQELDPHDIDQL